MNFAGLPLISSYISRRKRSTSHFLYCINIQTTSL